MLNQSTFVFSPDIAAIIGTLPISGMFTLLGSTHLHILLQLPDMPPLGAAVYLAPFYSGSVGNWD